MENNKPVTAVEWYAEKDNLLVIDFLEGKISQLQLLDAKIKLLREANEMHRRQIMKANRDGVDMAVDKKPFITAEQYYNNTFEK